MWLRAARWPSSGLGAISRILRRSAAASFDPLPVNRKRSAVPLGGLIVLSGMLFAREAWQAGMRQRRDLRVVQAHGTADPILPYRGAERLRDDLERAGIDLTWVPFPGGHGIGPGALEAVAALLTRVASSAGPGGAAR